ncbi:unnamed protein product [Camellia sinensis]
MAYKHKTGNLSTHQSQKTYFQWTSSLFGKPWKIAKDKASQTQSIGVSNFSSKELGDILTFATIPPAVNQEMAAEIEMLKRRIKEKGIAGEGNLSERTPSPHPSSRRQERMSSLSITRNYGVGDSETQRLTALQRLSTQLHCSEEVAMPAPRVVDPALMDKELARLTATPLSPEIKGTPLPAGFHQPKFTLYDGKTDPYMHVSHYRQVMAGHRHNDALMCLIFPASLGELGLKWFERFPEGSIEGWQQLAEAFVTRFKTNTQTPKEVNHLLGVKMESGGSLKAYNAKYWETYNKILNCPTNLAITQYKRGLPVKHRLRDSLTMHQPTTMESLMQRINERIRVEDDAASATEKANTVAADRRVAGKVHVVRQDDGHANHHGRDIGSSVFGRR